MLRVGSAFAALVAVAGFAVALPKAAGPDAAPPLFEALVRSVSVEGASLSQADVRVGVALRAARNLTVRRLAFRDSSVEGVPVWIDAVAGEWKLREGQPFELPEPLRARVPTLDFLQMEHLASAVRRRTVVVRTTVEIEVATPWSARLFFAGPTRPAILRAEVEAPLASAPGLLQPLMALSALVGERVRSTVSPMAAGFSQLSPARRALLAAVSPSLATLTVSYDLVTPDGERQARTRQTLGFAISDGVLCTTREAFEPWRFDVDEAVALQVRNGKLDGAGPRVSLAWHAGGPTVALDGAALRARLPRVDGRTLRTPVDNRVRRVTLLDRDTPANVVCLSLDVPGAGRGGDWRRDARAAGEDAAVFVSQGAGPASLVWTRVSAGVDGAAPHLAAPLAAASLGSPVVAANGLVGMVVSDRGVRSLADLERGAARAAPVD